MTYAIFTLPRALKRSQEQLENNLKHFEARVKAQREAKGITEDGEEADEEEEDGAGGEDTKAQATPKITTTAPSMDEEPKKEL